MSEKQCGIYYGDNYLIHHGILGQKWGKKNGPPYPLDEKDHSAAEKKAAKSEKIKTGLKRAGAATTATVVAVGTAMAAKDLKDKSEVVKDRERERRQSYSNKADEMSTSELQEANKREAAKKQYIKNKLEEESAKSGGIDKNIEYTRTMAKEMKSINKVISEAFKTSEYVGRNVDEMSNKELQDAITRLNLENQYIKLNTKTNVSKGFQYVDMMLDLLAPTVVIVGGAIKISKMIK